MLDHLGDVVSSHSLQRLSWPISEFADEEKMGNGTYNTLIPLWNRQAIKKLKLSLTRRGRHTLRDMLQRQFSSCDIPVFAKKNSFAGTEFCPFNMLHEIQQV